MDLNLAINSARTLRRLKPDPVPENLITQVLHAATQAPSAGNAQNWVFLVVRDPARRAALGAIYRRASEIASAMYAARGRPPHLTEAQFQRMLTSGAWLWEHMGEAPVILLPCLRQPRLPPPAALAPEMQVHLEQERIYADQIRGASIYPAVQNIILTCRSLGLATLITTNHIRLEDEVRSELGIPADVFTYAMMPIGYPLGQFGPLTRRPVREVAFANRWDQPWPG